MRQRNDSGYPIAVHAERPFPVEPGDTVDFPDPVAGLTPIDEPEPTAEPDAEPAKPARTGKAKATPAAGEEATR